ncbi:MAG TPA: hypothetical protein VN541_06425 [Tepidisphaeraceae bacterium]|nr:hypothetical protein [Tepidisphaeraceae bacterium]
MDQVLTIVEIRSRFPARWVLLEDPQVDENMQVISGKVIAHSKDRDEVDRAALERRPKHSAFLYTGSMPEDAVIVL